MLIVIEVGCGSGGGVGRRGTHAVKVVISRPNRWTVVVMHDVDYSLNRGSITLLLSSSVYGFHLLTPHFLFTHFYHKLKL